MDPAARETKRAGIMADSIALGQKERHGLFSSPFSNAIGETNFTRELKPKLDEDKRVIIEPRNFHTSPMKKGAIDASLFEKPDYIATGCPYIPAQGMVARSGAKDGYLKAGHELPFKPAKVVPNKPHKMVYEHQTDYIERKKNYRDDDGAVIIGPRNFFTCSAKKGEVGKGTSFAGQWDHMADTYEQEKKNRRKELERHWDFIAKNHESKNFSQRAFTKGHFCSTKDVIGADRPQEIKAPKEREVRKVEHERAWRPSMPPRAGQNTCTLDKFPEYKENPPKELKRKMPVEGEPEAPPAFKMTHRNKTRPVNSVVCNMRNLKASFPSAFKK